MKKTVIGHQSNHLILSYIFQIANKSNYSSATSVT